ncbi:hypothetical protein [Sphingomonas sp. OK281]|uniref:hypothetical protein n=1 Tax=Sphingomonas sp. OK281 TaxID=1881067 RepID=UPI0008EDC744|nr:hypothetical protein [Sphingomonas sp. OK281]SFO33369.1 hypothetical protein SAMN05428984_3431 [Sphingomonas sp. OK281]
MPTEKLLQGTTEWFEMVGDLLVAAASRAHLPRDMNLSLVERYTDGAELADGSRQGIRLDIRNGVMTFRVGVRENEQADIINNLTTAAARTLNLLYSDDPDFAKARDQLLTTGEMRISGDLAQFGAWFDATHDPIVDRTK